jgi:hypothetical protein
MKSGARSAFSGNAKGGMQTVKLFLQALEQGAHPKQVHLVGHSTGGILLAWLLDALTRSGIDTPIASCNLLAPAASVDLFNQRFVPELNGRIDKLRIYNLSEQLEEDDNVARVYRKSLLHLVSRAFEERHEEKILGMQRYAKEIQPPTDADFEIIVSKGENGRHKRSRSESHGGFDNDVATMNDLLKTVLGKKAPRQFTKEDLEY